MELGKLIKSFGEKITAKKYTGILNGGNSIQSREWGATDFLTALDISLYTNKAITKRSEKVGEIEFALYDKNGKKIENDPVLDLLNKPNDLMTGRQFWALYQKYYDTIGEAYIYIERASEVFEKSKPKALHILMPISVTPKFDESGKPVSYKYKTHNGGEVDYKAEEIIYIYNPNPKNPLRGVSLLKSGVDSIKTETQINSYHSSVLNNGGKVEGVFKFKTGSLTESQLASLKDQYRKEYSSSKKSGVPLFLGGDAEYIKTGLSPDELSFLETKKMTLEDICILTSVPKSMLASTADVKFDNADADRSIFLRETIKPLLITLTTALDYALFPDDRLLRFIDPTPENIDQKIKIAESGIKNYFMTINEVRKTFNLDPVDNGDDLLVPFSLMPLGTDSSTTDDTKAKSARVVEHPLADPEIRKMYWRMQIKKLDRKEGMFKRAVDSYFKHQEKRLIEQLSPKKSRTFRNKDIGDFLKLELEVRIGKELFLPLMKELLLDSGESALELTGSKYKFNLNDEIVSWLDNRAELFLTSINETTFGQLKSDFQDTLDNGEGREALINRIQNTYGEITKGRAGVIARTEVHNSTQYGTVQGYKQGGMTTKIWVSVQDGETRESHASLDGEEVPIDRPFSNGLMFPGDPRGDASETINCRCVI